MFFGDLYGQAEVIVDELKTQRSQESRLHARHLAGTNLELPQDSFGGLSTSCIWSDYPNFKAPLLLIKAHQTTPCAVRGYRQRETSGDYSLTRRDSGLITCRLGNAGCRDVQASEVEPLGDNQEADNQKVRSLPLERRQRLEVVAQGILTNLKLVERLRARHDPAEAFAIGQQ